MAYQHIFTQFRIGAPTGGGRGEAAPPPSQSEIKKKHRFHRPDYSKGFAWFMLQPKSSTENGWWPVHWNIEKYIKT